MRHYYTADAIRQAEAPLLASMPEGALMRRAAYPLSVAIARELTARTGGVAAGASGGGGIRRQRRRRTVGVDVSAPPGSGRLGGAAQAGEVAETGSPHSIAPAAVS